MFAGTAMRLLGVLIVAATVVVNSTQAADCPSLLVNGGFEERKGDNVPGWTLAFYPRRPGVDRCLSLSRERVKSGEWSLKIDTGAVLGEETTLLFNGTVQRDALALQGRKLVFTGWVYIQPGTAARPIAMRLRTFAKDQQGNSTFLRDVLTGTVLGTPGTWTQFRFTGLVPQAEITQIDLHCSIRPDLVPTVQFLDDLRLEAELPPPLEMQPLRSTLWDDDRLLPIEMQLHRESGEGSTLTFRLLDAQGRERLRQSRPRVPGILSVELPKSPLPEGHYVLRAELQNAGGALDVAEAPLEIVESPWKDDPREDLPTEFTTTAADVPEGFQVMGSVAPTAVADAAGTQPEEVGDVDLEQAQARGYAVFSRHWLEATSRLSRPRPGEAGPVRLLACGGQYELAAVSVWAIRAQTGLRLRVSDLLGPSGRLPATNVDVRVVRTLPRLPAFLERRPAVDIPAGDTQTFWLTVCVPPTTAAGFYRGQIEVVPLQGEPMRRELLLRVLPLKLPPPQKGYGFWWVMDGRWNGYYSKDRSQAMEQIRKQFILLREHNCNMVSCHSMPKMTRSENGSITFDFEHDHWGHVMYSLADIVRLGRETGLFSARVPLQYTGADALHSDSVARLVKAEPNSPAFAAFYHDACQKVDQWLKAQGFTPAFACVDEIGNSPERRETALRFYRIAHEAGVLTSVTDNSMHGGVHLMGQRRFDELISMRLYNFITPEMIEETRRSGDILWLYNLASGGNDARRDRFVFGVFAERCGAEGCAQWAFQFPKGPANPYQAAAAGGPTGYHYALPAEDGPLPTLALEGLRAGIDDARYLALLPAESRKAFLQDVEPLSITIAEQLARRDGEHFDALRWRIARQALRTKTSQTSER